MVKIVSYSKDYMDLICGALEKCYGKRPLSPEKAIQAGHLSVLEHAYATFDIECSLAVLGQLTRHRHFSFTVASTRGREMDEWYSPITIDGCEMEFEDVFDLYRDLIKHGTPKQDAAYLLPKATLTSLRMTGNLRCWYEYLPKRLCQRAMPEHREIAERIHADLTLAMPEIFNRKFLDCSNCKETGCTF